MVIIRSPESVAYVVNVFVVEVGDVDDFGEKIAGPPAVTGCQQNFSCGKKNKDFPRLQTKSKKLGKLLKPNKNPPTLIDVAT